MKNPSKKRSPWAWIPSLYLAQGLPYVAVMTISVVMYKRMGISNADIALYTSWLYLPWVIKPLWSPFVDLLKTKRWWIYTMQILVAAGFAGIALTIPVPFFFQATLAFFWLMAFSSATHDIAADGFYMLALEPADQALYVGIRSTFYRIATLTGSGILVILAGFMENFTGAEPLKIQIEASPEYTHTLVIPEMPANISEQSGDVRFLTNMDVLKIGVQKIHKDSLKTLVETVNAMNEQNGFIFKEVGKDAKKLAKSDTTKTAFEKWIKNHFGEKTAVVTSNEAGNIGILFVHLSKKPDNGKTVILNSSRSIGDASISLLHGSRLIFDETNWNKPAYMIFQLDPKLTYSTKAEFKGLSGNISFAWSTTFFVLAGLFVLFALYHRYILPRPDTDKHHTNVKAKQIVSEFGKTFVSFFKKPQILTALFFMLTFRFSESQLLKLIQPFMLDPLDKGGLGLSTGMVGTVYGTVGMISLTIGGIIGGIAASRGGLRKWIWPMTLSMLLTAMTFLYLGITQDARIWIVNVCVFIEQFGYGFGFTAYMLYLMYFAQGEQKTAHYAICTGFMALGMMLPGMFAGWLQELLGYKNFFAWVTICSIIPIIAVSLLKIDSEYGRKKVTT